jgi:hypothetical protein
MKLQVRVGSANILILDSFPDGYAPTNLRLHDPIQVKTEIGLADVTERLFPFIAVGVRFWPFLLVARDVDDQSRRAVQSVLTRIQRNQRQRSGQPRRSIGPGTVATFRPYRSMFRELNDSKQQSTQALRCFLLDGRRRYHGDPTTFNRNRNSVQWSRLLIGAMGRPARQFAALLRHEQARRSTRAVGGVDVVEQAITRILKDRRRRYDPLLWRGAACYAFLRCMYGINEVEDGIRPHRQAGEWAKTLAEELRRTTRPEAVAFRKYIAAIQEAESKPPWGGMHRRLKERNRRVLASLRFFTFYSLSCRPVPDGW